MGKTNHNNLSVSRISSPHRQNGQANHWYAPKGPRPRPQRRSRSRTNSWLHLVVRIPRPSDAPPRQLLPEAGGPASKEPRHRLNHIRLPSRSDSMAMKWQWPPRSDTARALETARITIELAG